MAFPDERIEDLTPGSKVKAATLMEHEDAIIGGKHGDVPINLNPNIGYGENVVRDPGYVKLLAGGFLYITLPMPVGGRLKSVTFAGFGDGASDIELDVYKTTKGGVRTGIESIAVNDAAAAWADTVLPIEPNVIAADGDTFLLHFRAVLINVEFRLGSVRFTYDKP